MRTPGYEQVCNGASLWQSVSFPFPDMRAAQARVSELTEEIAGAADAVQEVLRLDRSLLLGQMLFSLSTRANIISRGRHDFFLTGSL